MANYYIAGLELSLNLQTSFGYHIERFFALEAFYVLVLSGLRTWRTGKGSS